MMKRDVQVTWVVEFWLISCVQVVGGVGKWEPPNDSYARVFSCLVDKCFLTRVPTSRSIAFFRR